MVRWHTKIIAREWNVDQKGCNFQKDETLTGLIKYDECKNC